MTAVLAYVVVAQSVPGLPLLPGDANFSLRCLLWQAREEGIQI